MGAICHHKEVAEKNYTTRSISASTAKQAEKIRVTTKNINKSGEECLMLFVDTQCNIRRNQFLSQLKSNVSSKLQDYLDVELKGKCMNPGDCLVLNVLVENLEFKWVAFLCINVWEGSNKGLQDPLQDDIEQAIDAIKGKNIGSVCITQFNTELGVPIHIGSKTISRALLNKMNDLGSITVACLKQQHQNSILEALRSEQGKRLGGSQRNSLVNSIKSDYY